MYYRCTQQLEITKTNADPKQDHRSGPNVLGYVTVLGGN